MKILINEKQKVKPLKNLNSFILNDRAARGKHLGLIIRFANPGRNVDDIEVFTHTNDTLASLRRTILRKIKASGANIKLDLFINGESLEQTDDRKLLSQIPLRDKMVKKFCLFDYKKTN